MDKVTNGAIARLIVTKPSGRLQRHAVCVFLAEKYGVPAKRVPWWRLLWWRFLDWRDQQ